MYMANVSLNARRPNVTYIPPFRIGSRWVDRGSRWDDRGCVGWIGGRDGSARLFEYQHVGIPSMTLSCWVSKPTQGLFIVVG